MVNIQSTLIDWQTNCWSLIGLQNPKGLITIRVHKMSLPTAHSYVIGNLMEYLVSVEKNFLQPKVLMQLLAKTEEALIEGSETLRKKEFSEETFDKEALKLLIDKLMLLEKASKEKLSWVNNFSNYLQVNIDTK